MRRFVAALAILTTLVGLSTLCMVDLHNRTDQALAIIAKAEQAALADDAPQTLRRVQELVAAWGSYEKTLSHYIRHDQLEEISTLLARVEVLAQVNDPTDLAADLREVRHRIEHLLMFELPLIHKVV